MKKKVYLLGALSTEARHELLKKFSAAEAYINNQFGFDACNPTKIGPSGGDWKIMLRALIPAMLECDMIYLLPDWPKCRYAIVQKYVAVCLDMKVIESETHEE